MITVVYKAAHDTLKVSLVGYCVHDTFKVSLVDWIQSTSTELTALFLPIATPKV